MAATNPSGALPRVRAPELTGRGWLNTGGVRLRLADLRGRIVLLDFWTSCCVNCLHVIDELRPLEEKYADVLVTIGVHSPKFEHEKDPHALAAAVERYEVHHPVLDDPELTTWDQYAARAWPTLAVVDPEGYVVAMMAGEGHAAGLAALIDQLVEVHAAKGTLRRGRGPYVPDRHSGTDLRYPGKAIANPTGGYLVSSSAQHQIVHLDADLGRVLGRIGSGERGRADGGPEQASFAEPQGLCLLPAHVAELAGYDLAVADTVNHLLRGVRLADGQVTTVAGTGRPWRAGPDGYVRDPHPHDALAVDLSSPWDLAWYQGQLIIAMAGIHQLWWYDPVKRTAGVYAGTTVESLRDGPAPDTWLAQPSGLSVGSLGRRLWFVDSESSALRWVEDGEVNTAVGQGLFDFGLVDGAAATALLQHPLGVYARPDGSVLVADTYNGAVRLLRDGEVSTVAMDLDEPSDVLAAPDGEIIVVESGAHRLTALPGVDAAEGPRERGRSRPRTQRRPMDVAPGEVTLDIIFTPAPGQKLDDSFGSPVWLEVSAQPSALLTAGAGRSTELRRTLSFAPDAAFAPDGAEGVLQVVAQVATCDAEGEHPACHLTRQDWGVPVRVTPSGERRLPLILRGLDA
jgi:thiol-disulfide isomerase/thioredoxin